MSGDDIVDDKNRLLFGAGFAFGVVFTMLVLAVVVAAVTGELLGTDLFVTIGAGVVLAAIVGTGLYVLAFPENRLKIPIGDALDPETAASGDASGGTAETDPGGTAGQNEAGENPPE